MPRFTNSDQEAINQSYKELLFHLRNYLKKCDSQDILDDSKILLDMLHKGLFSMNRVILFENDYHYLSFPSEISSGVQVMYGVCCCRHVTDFFYDLLSVLELQPSLMYLYIDHSTGDWHKVNPGSEKINHVVVLLEYLTEQYIIDPRNRFLLRKGSHGELELLNIELEKDLSDYQDSNIEIIGKILKKYYTYQGLGISHVYEY